MAQYTIVTNREQEAGLNYVYEKHKINDEQTKAQFLQDRCTHQVLNPMFVEWKRSQATNLEASVATIPEANETKAKTEMEAVIVSNGGTIVTVDTNPPLIPVPSIPGGFIQAPRGTSGNPIQVGGTDKTTPDTSRPDGGGDNSSEK